MPLAQGAGVDEQVASGGIVVDLQPADAPGNAFVLGSVISLRGAKVQPPVAMRCVVYALRFFQQQRFVYGGRGGIGHIEYGPIAAGDGCPCL